VELYKTLTNKLILPVSDLFLGNNISKNLKFLERSQTWSRDKLVDFQNEKFLKMISHIYNNVPFYTEYFKKNKLLPADIKSLADIHKLPIISKDTIRNVGLEQFLAVNYDKKKARSYFSSGSTGEPFQYFMTQESYSMKYASALRGWSWMGYGLGDHYVKMSQNQRTGFVKKSQDFINRCNYYFIPDLKEESLHKILNKLQKDRPQFLRSYPDPLFFLARLMIKNDIKINFLKGINTTGNILFPEARTLIEERMGCRIYDTYSVEGSAMFDQTKNFDGYLGAMECAFTEVLDKNGYSVKEGETGAHITTELWNYAMPFIRYKTQDMVELGKQMSVNGKNLFILNKIIGRENDILIAPDGNLLIVHLFTIYFEYFRSIQQFQVEQTKKDEFIFRLVVNDHFTSETENNILKYWREFLGKRVRVILEIRDEIPILKSGKRKFLIRNRDIPLPY